MSASNRGDCSQGTPCRQRMNQTAMPFLPRSNTIAAAQRVSPVLSPGIGVLARRHCRPLEPEIKCYLWQARPFVKWHHAYQGIARQSNFAVRRQYPPCPFRVSGGKSHFEQIWSALPQTADIDYGREDFSVGHRFGLMQRSETTVRRLAYRFCTYFGISCTTRVTAVATFRRRPRDRRRKIIQTPVCNPLGA
jgi:hypothetical protein